jgi:glycosyltransferase involved in cell wall biosynthesis
LVTLKRHASEVSGFAPCVRVVLQPDEGWDLHSAHLPAFAQARAICIPLVDVRNLAGLTSVMDALGAGRPMLLTRHPLIDLDVDGLGIGRTIPVGDVDAWAAALRDYQSAPERAAEEGARARALVDSGLNSVRYAGEIDRILKGVLASSGTAPP